MPRIVAIVPLKDGMIIPKEVIQPLVAQTVDVDIMPVSRPKEGIKGNISRNICRNIARETWLKEYDHNLVLLLNRDIILPSSTDVEEMSRFLEENPEYGAVALRRTPLDSPDGHIGIACVLTRREVLEKIMFRHADEDFCDCNCFRKDLKSIGLKIRYLDQRLIIDLFQEEV